MALTKSMLWVAVKTFSNNGEEEISVVAGSSRVPSIEDSEEVKKNLLLLTSTSLFVECSTFAPSIEMNGF